MNKKRNVIDLFLVILLCFFFAYFINNEFILKDNKIEISNKSTKTYKNVAIMYETKLESGEYIPVNETEWPTEGYVYNEILSVCENGSTMSWDDTNNKVNVTANISDKCYVYFDVAPTLANYVKGLYTTDGENGLYLHDGVGTYTNANLEIGDNSYRYAGANPNNFVCFGSDVTPCPYENLYRIIGVFGDQVKLIKHDAASATILGTNADDTYSYSSTYYKGELTTYSAYYWHTTNSNNWINSRTNTMLNGKYLTNLGNWGDKIEETTWVVGGNTLSNINSTNAKTAYDYEIVNPAETTTHPAKIGLMYVSDYMYGAEPTYWSYKGYGSVSTDYRAALANNWMGMGIEEWTITPSSSSFDVVFYISPAGYLNEAPVHYPGYDLAIRPCFSLKSYIEYTYEGDGSRNNPYRIS